MDVLQTVGLMLLALTILIVIHELGHFWAARIFGMRVEAFALFFGPKLFGVKRGETEWRFNLVPLGGYVKISGMLDEHMDTDQMAQEPQPWEFRSKPSWQRLIVMLGGIIMNIILGCLIFISLKYANGDNRIDNSKLEYGIFVSDSTAAQELGFRTGDRLVTYMGDSITWFDDASDPNNLVDRGKYFEVLRNGELIRIDIPDDYLNTFIDRKESSLFFPDGAPVITVMDTSADFNYKPGNPVNGFLGGLRKKDKILMIDSIPMERWSSVSTYLKGKPNTAMEFLVLRDNKEVKLTISTDSSSMVGIALYTKDFFTHIDYGIGGAIPAGIQEAFNRMWSTVKGLGALFTGNADPTKSVSGPIKIAGIYGNIFDRGGWTGFWVLTGMLSMVLAVMNLLPIPVLDGGQVVILIIEAIIGREIPPGVKEWILRIGFFLVVALMIFVFANDIISLATGD
ncbi:MAG: RIP metalloprotease RseP [Bacteroidota bacterium]